MKILKLTMRKLSTQNNLKRLSLRKIKKKYGIMSKLNFIKKKEKKLKIVKI